MAAPLIVSVSGVRGIIGESLGPREATDFGLAYGVFLREANPAKGAPKVCMGRDGRPSGDMLASALGAGLMASGCQTVNLGVVTTPGVALMCRYLSCDGAVVITASHNPAPYNGIKFLRNDGVAYQSDEAGRIHQIYRDKQFEMKDATAVVPSISDSRAHAVHTDTVLGICDKTLIASKRFRVVLDSINGAGCVVTANLLSALGCEVVHLNNRPTGLFAHPPEPTAENLADLGGQVSKHGAVIGFAQDPDADRLAVIDENGCYIGEEYTLALAAKHIFGRKKGAAATNLSTSRMIDDLAAAGGSTVIRTAVGEAHVAGAMIANDCIIGGEGNGGVIDLRVGPVRDSLVGIALILELLAETGKSVSELVAEIPRYHMIKTKFACAPGQSVSAVEKVKKHYEGIAEQSGVAIDVRDGIRIDLPEGWVQLRPSNTEPVMRIMAESMRRDYAEQLIEQVRRLAGVEGV